jgi:hypothetical protein
MTRSISLLALFLLALPCYADTSATAQIGKNVILTVTVDGTAPFSFTWSKNNVALAGATSASYVIASATANDAGAYSCVVSNSAGSTTSDNATLTILPAMATLSVTETHVNGPAPALYVWRKNGVTIASGPVFTFDPVASPGSYSLTITYQNPPPLK